LVLLERNRARNQRRGKKKRERELAQKGSEGVKGRILVNVSVGEKVKVDRIERKKKKGPCREQAFRRRYTMNFRGRKRTQKEITPSQRVFQVKKKTNQGPLVAVTAQGKHLQGEKSGTD